MQMKEYNYMLTGVFDLLIAKQQEFDGYQNYIEAVRDYWITRTKLQQAVGGSLLPSDQENKTVRPVGTSSHIEEDKHAEQT